MARGNHVDLCISTYRFGIYIVEPYFKHQSFNSYKEIKISNNGTLIGYWGNGKYKYKDYLACGFNGFHIAKIKDSKLFLKPTN
jgi:hypothetical protein